MLDPLSVYFAADLAFNPYQLGNTDESIRQLRLTLAMDPQFPTTHMYLAMAYAGKGEFDNALAAAKRSVELDPEDLFTTGTLGYVYGKAGKRARRGRSSNDCTRPRVTNAYPRTTLRSFSLDSANASRLSTISGERTRRGSISFPR